jgi:tetratricopeptide (TPR) repeat protein
MYFFLSLLVLLIPLEDTRPGRIEAEYDRVWRLFQRGRLAQCQKEAERGYREFKTADPEWSAKFRLLEAQAIVVRGSYTDALRILAEGPNSRNPEVSVRRLAIQGVILTHRQDLQAAEEKFKQAEALCKDDDYAVCGDVIRARGALAMNKGQDSLARQYYLQTISFAHNHNDRFLEATASLNLGFAALQNSRYDEALDWSNSAYRSAKELGAEDLVEMASGNIGWAYYQLGDEDRSLELFHQAEESAKDLGDTRDELIWTSAAGYVYRDTGDLARATQSYHRAFDLANQLDSKEDIVNALEDLAQVSVDTGKLDEASSYIDQVTPRELAGGGRLSPNILLTQGMLAAARRQDQQAEALYRKVQGDATSPTTTRLTAGYELAKLYEFEGDSKAAEKMYKATLNEFDSAREQLKSEESKLPFVANAERIYDDYIQLLIHVGRSDEALAIADQSRARTLAQALGVAEGKNALRTTAMSPRQISAKTGATLLFYWLGEKQSYLWAVTPSRTTLFPLGPRREISEQIERYNKILLSLHDPLKLRNQDGQALYKMLVAPATPLIHPNAPVILLADGALSQLNFETLLVPGASDQVMQTSGPSPSLHYLLEDATLLSAPSLAMLAAAKPVHDADTGLLLLGNPVSPRDDFPSLPLFGLEMAGIKKHFAPQRVAAFDGLQATPAAYLTGNPARYSYIHFVSHAVASRTDPLDSAIILSDSKPGEDSFKL